MKKCLTKNKKNTNDKLNHLIKNSIANWEHALFNKKLD